MPQRCDDRPDDDDHDDGRVGQRHDHQETRRGLQDHHDDHSPRDPHPANGDYDKGYDDGYRNGYDKGYENGNGSDKHKSKHDDDS